ncbi:MAG TPA: glutamate-cysteine ligase family protein, partial [Candidatus Omnitrophota bacterium]|nr:glutamate-cysteine ligase family protein [Candidatus Omnitrophota bacterium]
KKMFLAGFKPRSEHKIGVEWEKLGVYRDSCLAIPYKGERGVERIFKALIRDFGWRSASSANTPIIALRRKGASITLEPGGQIELSGQKQASLCANFKELFLHLDEIRSISRELGVAWLGIGAQPVSKSNSIPWVPKKRYAIMRRALQKTGRLTHSMMKETASIQISLDYSDEGDAIQKFRLAMALAPFLTGIFANSPLERGRQSDYLSRRAHIWRHTASERTGLMADVFKKRFGFGEYVRHALSVPLLFIIRKDRWIAVRGRTFGDFMKKGYGPWKAESADWRLHLSTLFTEARLKTYLEIRSIDCQSIPLSLAAPALIKGIFYGRGSLKDAWKEIGGGEGAQYQKLLVDAARLGLRARWGHRFIWDTAKELIAIAESGLPEGERHYLFPLKELVILKRKTPSQDLMDRIRAQERSMPQAERIIRSCEI